MYSKWKLIRARSLIQKYADYTNNLYSKDTSSCFLFNNERSALSIVRPIGSNQNKNCYFKLLMQIMAHSGSYKAIFDAKIEPLRIISNIFFC